MKRAGVFIDPLSLYVGRRAVPAAARERFERDAFQRGAELDQIAVNGETLAPPDEVAPPPSGMPVPGMAPPPAAPEPDGSDESMDDHDGAD